MYTSFSWPPWGPSARFETDNQCWIQAGEWRSVSLVKLLITGGAGFIGSHLAEAALAVGYEVVVVDDLSTGRRENVPAGARLHVQDICDASATRALLVAERPDVVSHQAAQTSVVRSVREPLEDARINVLGSLSVIEASLAADVHKLVFASSGGAIYGEVPERKRAATSWPTVPLSPYGVSKLAVERYLESYHKLRGLQAVALRYANVFGPRQDPRGEAGVVAIFLDRVARGEPVEVHGRRTAGDGGCVRDYIFVEDVVKANLRVLVEDTPAKVNVCTGVGTTTAALLDAVEEVLGRPALRTSTPPRSGDLQCSILEPPRGVETKPLLEALASMVT